MIDGRTADGTVVNSRDDPRSFLHDEGRIFWLTHLVYWPLYLLAAFPLHAFYHLSRYVWRHTFPVALVLAPFDLVRVLRYRHLCTPSDRLLMLLRASWVLTPSDVCPWLYRHGEYEANARLAVATRPEEWSEMVAYVIERDGRACTCCGASADDPTVSLGGDRIVPYERGGFAEVENMRTLCRRCREARFATLFDEDGP